MNTNAMTGGKTSVNVGKAERVASILAGTILAYKSLTGRHGYRLPMLLGGSYLLYRGATGHCAAYEAAGKKHLPDTVQNINIHTKIVVNKPRHEVYSFWRQLSNLPLFMKHLERVDVCDNNQSHWVAKLPGGFGTVEWDAAIVKETEGELLGWNSLPNATIDNAGKVEFKDSADGYGTELDITITYRAPLGDVGEGIAKLLNPIMQKAIEKDVQQFRQFIEAARFSYQDGVSTE